MEENFNVYYCTVCHLCKTPPSRQVGIKFCSGCRLVQYCCSSHQKQDWQDHKQFCKCIKQILSTTGRNHVFGQEDETEQNKVSWDKERANVTFLLEGLLGRPLTPIESQIILFPPVCNFCHYYKPNRMFTCSSCHTVVYCCSEHKNKDKKHVRSCSFLCKSFHTDILRFFRESSSILCPLELWNSDPHSMEDVLSNENELTTERKLLLSEPLSFSLTMVFAIKVSELRNENLKIHVVGADFMEVSATETFPVIFHLLRQLSHLELMLIGPSLPSNLEVNVPPEIDDKCSVSISNDAYHDYVKTSKYFTPDLIIVFKCGFCEFIDSPEKITGKIRCLVS